MFRESINGMESAEDADISGLKMFKSAEGAEIVMIADLVNHIIVEGVISIEWELITIVNYYKGKGDALERGNYGGLKEIDQILKKVKVEIDKATGRH